MKIGFTGTRNGMTAAQKGAVTRFLNATLSLPKSNNEAHHGDCIGSDAEFHYLVYDLARTVIHPGYSANNPTDDSKRAYCEGNEIRGPKNHFARNRDIIDETEMLLSTPPCKPLPSSGGTAYTIGYARKQRKPIVVIYPDGEVETA